MSALETDRREMKAELHVVETLRIIKLVCSKLWGETRFGSAPFRTDDQDVIMFTYLERIEWEEICL